MDWRKVRELQGVGRCLPATREQDAVAWSLYLSKFGQESTRPPGILHTITPSEGLAYEPGQIVFWPADASGEYDAGQV